MIDEASAAGVARCDCVLRGGLVIDGSGGPPVRADVGIRGDRIVAVGELTATRAEESIDISGRAVAPGFIDIHTHDDRALLSAPDMLAKVSQGVTTVVTGNCGVSLAPLAFDGELPATFQLLGDKQWYRFPDLAGYFAELEQRPPAVNAVCLVGHSTLRLGAMDDLERPADDGEIEVMQQRLAQALDTGAAGLSTGLYYPTGRPAPTAEVVALAKVMSGKSGIYATHMRDEADGVEASVEETLQIGREADLASQGDRAEELRPLGADARPHRARAARAEGGTRRLSLCRRLDGARSQALRRPNARGRHLVQATSRSGRARHRRDRA
jgi:N-acyl-D-amino-acid deacylase